MFKNWFNKNNKNNKNNKKNVWEIVDYWVSCEDYRKQCEKIKFCGDIKDILRPILLNEKDEKKLNHKHEIQRYSNYVESLRIYNEFTNDTKEALFLYESHLRLLIADLI